jgi:hypothetical protein
MIRPVQAMNPACTLVLCLFWGCNVNVPFDPATVLQPIDDAFQEAQQFIEGAVADPLGAKPFPVLVGGDSERVFYATTLTDVRLNFPGPTSDFIIPGFSGPSNLYKFEDRQRDLIRPLVPGGAFLGMATDGRYVAYVAIEDVELLRFSVRAVEVNSLTEQVVFDPSAEEGLFFLPPFVLGQVLDVSEGRLAFALFDEENVVPRLRVVDLTGVEPTLEFDTGRIESFDLLANRLAYSETEENGDARLVLKNLSITDDGLTEIAHFDPSEYDVPVFQSNNGVVWSEGSHEGLVRVMRYDVPTGTTRVWADAASGVLTGASDDFFITEELVERYPQNPNQIVVRRYSADGQVRVFARFRADGLSGQSLVIGLRAAWVNPERKIVLAPLGGGDRTIFQPF